MASTTESFWGDLNSRIPEVWEVHGDSYVEREGILAMLADADRGDIVVYEGHGNDTVIAPNWYVLGQDPVSSTDLSRAVETDDSAPSVVLLSSCQSAGRSAIDASPAHPLMDDLVDSGVGVVFGWAGSVNTVTARNAAMTLVEELTGGATLQEALDAANNTPGIPSGGGAEMRMVLGEGIRGDRTLEENGLEFDDEAADAEPTPPSSEGE